MSTSLVCLLKNPVRSTTRRVVILNDSVSAASFQ